MKKLNALALFAVMAPACTIGISNVLAAEQDRGPRTHQEADESISGQQSSAMDSNRSAETARSGEGSRTEEMPKNESQTLGQSNQPGQSGDAAAAFQADDLIGKDVKNRNDDETIGSINDLVFGEDGQILSVIVGVGGFLGMGKKDVAISWSEVERQVDEDGDSYVITVDRDEQSLKDATAHNRSDLRSNSIN